MVAWSMGCFMKRNLQSTFRSRFIIISFVIFVSSFIIQAVTYYHILSQNKIIKLYYVSLPTYGITESNLLYFYFFNNIIVHKYFNITLHRMYLLQFTNVQIIIKNI